MEEDIQSTTTDKMNAARRWFLKLLIVVIAFVISVMLGIPFIRALVASRLQKGNNPGTRLPT